MNKVVYDIDRFVKDLDKYLKENEISQARFARSISFSEAKVSRLLNGTRPRLNIHDLYAIAKYIGVSADTYVIGKGQSFDLNIRDMSIEDIDRMMEELRTVRKEKIDAEWAKLNAEQERLLKLKSMEE